MVLVKRLETCEMACLGCAGLCGLRKDNLSHIFFHCMHSKIFWIDVQKFPLRKTGQMVIPYGCDILLLISKITQWTKILDF